MKINVSDDKKIIIREIYSDTFLETKSGNRLAVCMDDDAIEMSVPGSDRWFRVDMDTGDIREI